MSGLDIESVLRAHETVATGLGEWCCKCSPAEWRPSAHRAPHVAAVLREQIAAWLTTEGKREMHERGGHWHSATTSDVHVARKLTALAALVAPSRVPSEES